MSSASPLPLLLDGHPAELIDRVTALRTGLGLATTRTISRQTLSGAVLAIDFPADATIAQAEQSIRDMWGALWDNLGALSQTVSIFLAVRDDADTSPTDRRSLISALGRLLADIDIEATNTFGNDMHVNALLYSTADPLDQVATRLHQFGARTNPPIGDREILTFDDIHHDTIAVAIARRAL